MGGTPFKVLEVSGETLRLGYHGVGAKELTKQFDTNVPAGLAEAAPQRIAAIVHDPALMKKVARVNPAGVKKLAREGNAVAKNAVAAF